MLPLTPEARQLIVLWSQGDGRYLYNLIENIRSTSEQLLDEQGLQKILQKKSALYDKAGDQHYNLISALHKSVRGSDPDATLYWLARMLEGGEEPLFLARRLIRMAVEDIGLADPQALPLAIAARDAYEMLGSPEGELALAEAAIYLALAPKSNALYQGYNEARAQASQTTHLSPPATILNAPTSTMKKLGLWKRISVRSRTSRCLFRAGVFSPFHRAPLLLSSGRTGLRTGTQEAARLFPASQDQEKSVKKLNHCS